MLLKNFTDVTKRPLRLAYIYIFSNLYNLTSKAPLKTWFSNFGQRYIYVVSMYHLYMVHGTDVDSQLAKDIASLGLGFSQGRHVKI